MYSHMTHVRTYVAGFLESYEGRDVSGTASRCRRDIPRL